MQVGKRFMLIINQPVIQSLSISNKNCIFGSYLIGETTKAYYVQKYKKHAPFIHNLYRLAELNELELTENYADWLDKITSFNLNARYDDYKREFYSLCTENYTKEWIGKIKSLREWITQKL